MKAFVLFFMIFLFSAQADEGNDHNKNQLSSNKSFQQFMEEILNSTQYQPFNYEEVRKAIGVIVVPKFERNDLGTGFFISDKWFVTSFQIIDDFNSRRNNQIVIWINDQLFPVKNAVALSAVYNLAVLEVDSSYEGAVLELSEEPLNIEETVYAFGFDEQELSSMAGITSDRLLKMAKNGQISSSQTNELLLNINVLSQQSLSDYHFFHLDRIYLKEGAEGLPFLNERGEVLSVQFDSSWNLAYAAPVKYLKKMLGESDYHCQRIPLSECLDKALENLYEQSIDGDPLAQYSYSSRLYNSERRMIEVLFAGGDADLFLQQSAEARHILSQIQLAKNSFSDSNCLNLPNQKVSWIKTGLNSLNFQTKEEEINKILEGVAWLNTEEVQDFSTTYFLKGLLLLNGYCMEKNIPLGLEYLESAAERGHFLSLLILANNYNAKNSILFNSQKGMHFSRKLNLIKDYYMVSRELFNILLINW